MHCFSQSLIDKRKGGQLIANRANFAPSAQAVSKSSEICVIREEKRTVPKVTSRYKQGELREFCAIRVWVFCQTNFTPIAPFYLQLLLSYLSKENKVL